MIKEIWGVQNNRCGTKLVKNGGGWKVGFTSVSVEIELGHTQRIDRREKGKISGDVHIRGVVQ